MTFIDIESFQVILRELNSFFNHPERRLPDLHFSYQDYLRADRLLQQTDYYRQQLERWRARLGDLPPAPALRLLKAPRELTELRFDIQRRALARERWQRIKATAERHGITTTDLMLGIYSLALIPWAGPQSFSLRLSYFDRKPYHVQAMNIVGDASAGMLVAVSPATVESFAELAQKIHQEVQGNLESGEVGYLNLLREKARSEGRDPRHEYGETAPIVFTSLMGVRHTYAVPETADPLLGMPSYEYAAQPQALIHLQALEEERSLLYNLDVLEEVFPEGFAKALISAMGSMLDLLSQGEELWSRPLREWVPAAPTILMPSMAEVEAYHE
jgi:yersiniabactin nonribosomal peptide/polyketide synthase